MSNFLIYSVVNILFLVFWSFRIYQTVKFLKLKKHQNSNYHYIVGLLVVQIILFLGFVFFHLVLLCGKFNLIILPPAFEHSGTYTIIFMIMIVLSICIRRYVRKSIANHTKNDENNKTKSTPKTIG